MPDVYLTINEADPALLAEIAEGLEVRAPSDQRDVVAAQRQTGADDAANRSSPVNHVSSCHRSSLAADVWQLRPATPLRPGPDQRQGTRDLPPRPSASQR